KIFVDDLPSIPIYYRLYTYAIDRKVHDVNENLIFEVSDRFAGITDWYLKTKRVLRTEAGPVRAARNRAPAGVRAGALPPRRAAPRPDPRGPPASSRCL